MRFVRRTDAWPVAALLIFTAAVYGRTLQSGFVALDDGVYVTTNRHVREGLTGSGLLYAATTGETGTWQPLTLLTHMMDCQVYGLRAGGHHATNLLLHLLTTVFLFWAFWKLTGRYGPSLFVAAVFALHPLHVESVAWISERKDVLSALFWMLTLLAYAGYARGRRSAYPLVALFLACGLMAKPMLVTLPCVLLLLDWWPLGRIGSAEHLWHWRTARRLAVEKVPLLLLSAGSAVITLKSQAETQSVISLDKLPLSLRLSNVAISYVRYVGQTLWPADLAVFYPFPRAGIALHAVFAAVVLLVLVTSGALALRRRAPYVLVGWLWYVGTLVPVIGLVQVGAQAHADRYMYVPMVGLAIIPAWGVLGLLESRLARARNGVRRHVNGLLWAVSIALCVLMGWRTHVQVGYWKNSESLFRHAAEVTTDNAVACANTGMALNDEGRFAEAVPFLNEALRSEPSDPFALFHLGVARQNLGETREAIACYQKALRGNPDNVQAMNNLGLCYLREGQSRLAAEALAQALRVQPGFVEAEGNYGAALLQSGRIDEALSHLQAAVKRHPEAPSLRVNLGIAWAALGRRDDAVREFEEALRLQPGNIEARKNLDILRGGEKSG